MTPAISRSGGDLSRAGFVGRAAVLGLLIIGFTFACAYWAIQHLASGHVAQILSSAPVIVFGVYIINRAERGG